MPLHILIPCKSFNAGKSRLASVLDAEARHALCAQFLAGTLDLALSLVPAARCHLVSGDTEAAALASARGAGLIADPGAGLNGALRAGRDAICAASDAITLLILPIDLPWANLATLAEFCDSGADVAIAPDRARAGTNALCLGPRAVQGFYFRFGTDSSAAHQAFAREHGWRVSVFDNARLAFDVDRPEDYREWRRDAEPAISGQAAVRR
jgi:2-phospho-L-lactate/phosphoenolpyruvate guanylyltransferase